MAEVLSLEGVSKSFGGSRVLRDVNLRVRAGEVHALVGENGSGKSTLVKILSGYHRADSLSRAAIGGVEVRLPLSGTMASRAGLGFVHQDLGLLDSGSVVENLLLGRFHMRLAWRIPWAAERRRTRRILDHYGLGEVRPTDLVGSLGGAQRAMLAVARAALALNRETHATSTPPAGGLLVVDEVTAYLPEDAVRRVLDTFRRTANLGFGVLLVTHRLEEVFAAADWVTVLRDGAVARSCAVKEVTRNELVGLMIGRVLDEGRLSVPPPASPRPAPRAAVEVSELSCDKVRGVSFAVGPGEVVGLTGLVGSGFESIPYAIFGAVRAEGALTVRGDHLRLHGLTPRRALDAGVALIPAGRLSRGAVGSATVAENMSLLTATRLWRRGFRGPREEVRRAVDMIERFDIRPGSPNIELARLSGGNQQKAIIAKWLTSDASLFVIHEPTQGVDVGAKGEILRAIRSLAETGKAILVASADQVDLARVCDRVLVLRDGGIHSELTGAHVTETNITAAAHGLSVAVA